MTQDPAMIGAMWAMGRHEVEVLLAIARSVKVANRAGSDRWGLRLDQDSLMLKVGPHEVLQVIRRERAKLCMPFHLIVDRELVPAHLRSRADLLFSKDRDCYGKKGASGYYASDPGTEACDFEFSVLKETYDALYDAHVAVVHRAAGLRLNPATRKNHSCALVSFLASKTGHSLPQPAWIPTQTK